ncbi:GNAT family acetyltransferase [Zavarzinia sp. CC-PAN008]|uniref:GNAT family acetyltransferase n=1 Tax=Zavarzinia sp. CC-PAN008 TaxID=3243332 RepID=UPI003F748F24
MAGAGELTIRPATAADEADVVARWRSSDLVASYNDPSVDFHFARSGASSVVLVAVSGSRAICGSVMVGHDGHRGWLYYLAADPGLRGRGIGRALVRAAEDWLRARGVPKVQLMVRPTNTQVMGFYETLGYEETPRVVMARWLDSGT